MISLLKSKSEFFNRRALYVSADKLSVYHWRKGALGESFLFDLDDVGRANFQRYLQESENIPMTILVDVIEEEFRQETIPHVFGADRQALIKRKQSRLYRDVSYLYTQDQGREDEGRRDDRLLFMALTKDEVLKPWLEVLNENKIPLSGILSVALLLQSYIKTLPDISDHALVVTLQSISGLRQTFFKKKELKISRLSKLPRYGTESYVPKIYAEVDKIQRYLNSLRLIPNDTPLDVYILADKATLDELESEKISSPMLHRHYLDIGELLEATTGGVSQAIPFCDQLLVHHLLKTQVKNCYACTEDLRYFKMRNMRYTMNAISIILLIFSVIYSGINFMSGMTYQQESETSKNKTDFYQTRYELARSRLPKTPVEPAQVKIAVEAASTLAEYKSTPYEMLRFLGAGLKQFPDIKLDDLDWSYSIDPNKGLAKTSVDNNSVSPSGEITEENKVKYYQISSLQAHIEPFDGNYRKAISLVNEFAETLRGYDSAYDISIDSFPLDVSSGAKLQGDAGTLEKSAVFTLRAVVGVN
ncbi:MAG: hypothetical protein DHS20C09_15860 [marine bacterium B5-7]|nr:MAG: hypothetical protein DHS20C09_15860 [marine bacterium B5-7]